MSTRTPDMIEQCRREALRLLRENLTPAGILAAGRTPRAIARRYDSIFGRDAAVCALAMVLSGDARLVRGAKAGLLTLARHQADNGQIPKYVDIRRHEPDFWYLGCIDATLWWLVALDFIARHAPDKKLEKKLAPNIGRAIAWLQCQEHPRLHLLQQNEASDWADIMPRSGFVLYTNALWYYVKKQYRLPRAGQTRHHFNHLFHPFSRDVPGYRRLQLLTHYARSRARRRDLYLSFVNFSFWGEEGDVFGNLLAVLFGLADKQQAARILRALDREKIDARHPVRVTCAPIRRTDSLWRAYMARHRQNFEHRYHNGGVWPFVGGFWVIMLAQLGKSRRAAGQLTRLAAVNQVNDWQFNEWFHGKTGQPSGMARQSWNAATFLLAQHALSGKIF
ncbi:MAG TPA: glycoside hydrolase 100 family protein [Sulfuricaulis sp.]|nr:glycoside hydrolase 100 family protein [Sulfuricaulis sp.]